MTPGRRIAVLGGGAWGTALAATMAAAGRPTMLWARDEDVVRMINERRENPRYLPGVELPAELAATSAPEEAAAGAECVLLATPAQSLRDAIGRMIGPIGASAPVVSCAKGIETATGKRPSEIIAAFLPPDRIAALSGPSFAGDLVRGLPTAVTVAAGEPGLAARLAGLLSTPHFRCYSSDDLVGVEIGGALKNVLAIAAGAAQGAGLGASAHAALVTRGFVELRRIASAFGARPETLMGLSGLGDLVLTCNSRQSRNFSYGLALGMGEGVDGLPLAEGVATARIAAEIVEARGIEAPIVQAVAAIIAGRAGVRETVARLMVRPLKSETA